MKLPIALLALLTVLLACSSADDSGEEIADTSESGDTGGPQDFPPVECGDVTCVEGQICVMPSETCDYQQDPPMWVQDPSVCLAVPESCYGLVDVELVQCLRGGLCSSGEESTATFMDGTLDCPPNGADCFE